MCFFALGAHASVLAQGDTGWWKNLFQGAQNSMCDSSATEQFAPKVPSLMICEPSGGDLKEEPSAPGPIETIEERPIEAPLDNVVALEQLEEEIAARAELRRRAQWDAPAPPLRTRPP